MMQQARCPAAPSARAYQSAYQIECDACPIRRHASPRIARTLPAVPARLGDRAARAGAGRLHAGRRRAAPGPPANQLLLAAGGPPSVMTALMDARAPSRPCPDMSAMSDPRDGGHAGQADDAAQECPFWMVAHQTLDLPPLPHLPALPAAAVASVAAAGAVPAAARGRPAASRAPRLSRPWPDRTIRARPRAFPAAVPPPSPSPPCAAFPVHDRRARRRHARGRPTCKDRDAPSCRTRVSNFRALALATALAAIFPRRPRPAGARLRHGSGGHHRRRARFAADLHHQSQDAAPAAAGQRRHRLPEDHSRLGHPQWRHQRRSGAARHVRFAPEHPDQRQRHARRLPGARMDAPSSYISARDPTSSPSSRTADRARPRRLGRHRASDRDTPRFTEAGVRFDGSRPAACSAAMTRPPTSPPATMRLRARHRQPLALAGLAKDGNGLRVPSRWDKWNTDPAPGLHAGRRHAVRADRRHRRRRGALRRPGMDGSSSSASFGRSRSATSAPRWKRSRPSSTTTTPTA